MGYDTNGDGQIDAIDYDGDGVIDARVGQPTPAPAIQGYAVNQPPPPAYGAPPPSYGHQQHAAVGMSAPVATGYAAPQRANMPTSVPQSGGRGYVQQPTSYVQQPAYQAPQQVAYQQQPAYQAPRQVAYQQPQQVAYHAPQQPAYHAPQQPAYHAPQQPAYQAPQAPVYNAVASPQPTAPPAAPQVGKTTAGGPGLLDFRSQDQKDVANNPDAVAVKGQGGLLIRGKAATKQGPSGAAKAADKAAIGATVIGAGALGAGAAVAATNPGMIEGAASALGNVGGEVIGAVGGLIGGLFK